jgi:excisionase family DNA binding protein
VTQKHAEIEVSVDEAALVLGLHSRTIRNLIVRREIKTCKVKGRQYVDQSSIIATKDKDFLLLDKAEHAAPMPEVYLKGLKDSPPTDCASMALACHPI